MKLALIFVVIALAFSVTPVARPSEATGVCGSSPSLTGNLYPTGLLINAGRAYITAACATINGQTTTLIQTGITVAVDPLGCFELRKEQHLAYIYGGPQWNRNCAPVTLTVRTVKAVG